MQAQLQFGEVDGLAVMVVYETPHTLGVDCRWIKTYPSRADACWDAERLALLPPATASAVKDLPSGVEIPALPAYVRDPKETLRTFVFFPLSQAH